MDIANAQNIFATRLYDWARRDLIREIHEGCPLMSLVGLNNRYVAAFVAWVSTLSKNDQEMLARDLTRRAHENAAGIRGEAMSRPEQKRFNDDLFDQISRREHSLPPLVSADRSLPSFEQLDPEACMVSLFGSLSPVLGKATQRKLRIRAERIIGDWKIITEFWFHRPDSYLFCEYQFSRKDGAFVAGKGGPFPTNPFLFYGVSDTFVVVPSQADCKRMVDAMVKVSVHFLPNLEALVAGLGTED